MSSKFIDHCLATIDRVLEGVGAYYQERVSENSDTAGVESANP